MSDSNRVALRYVEEVTFGTTPATDMTALRFTSEGLTPNIEFTQTEEIRSDRQIPDTIQTSSEPGGDISFELSYGTYDDHFKAALFDDNGWSTAISVSASDIDAAAGDNSFNTAGGDFTADNVTVGAWVEVRGFTDPANNGYFRVVSVTAAKMVVDGGTLVTEAAGDAITMVGQYIRNGTTRTSFTIEKEFEDITQFEVYTGMIPSDMELNIEADSILTGTLTYLGLGHTLQQVTAGTGTVTAATTTDSMNAVANVLKIVEGGDVVSDCVQTASISLTNNLRGIRCVGSLPNADVGVGRVDVTGSLEIYFENETIYDKFTAVTASSIAFVVEDVAGNAYVITLPRIKYTALEATAGGTDQDVVLALDFQALRDSTTDATIQIDRFAA